MNLRRDLGIAAMGAVAALAVVAIAQSEEPIMRSAIFDWNDIPVTHEEVRSVRQFFQAPTATLAELELHVTTLRPGDTSHAPHRHLNEELVIIKEGEIEALVNGELKRVGPGSVIFFASNELHGVRNVGEGPLTYHVINWRER